jgi:hypothetical protein
MLWTHPLLLAGLGALSIPVLIHLMMRAQGRRIRFSTLRFLPQTKPARERKKIRHWPLLLLRLLLVALLVAAFARPYWPLPATAAANRQQPRAVMLVLDRSASMQAREGGTTRWDLALAIAGKVLDRLSETDRVAIVAFAQQAEVVAPWGPRSNAEHVLAGLKASSEPGRAADGLRVAATLLDRAPGEAELVLVSDLQKSSCVGIDSVFLPAGTRCEIRQVGGPETPNVAVTGVHAESAGSAALLVDLRNFSAQKQAGLAVNVLLDHQPFFQGKVDLAEGGAASLALPAINAAAGWHQLQVEVLSGDALAADNRFFAAVLVPQPINVLVAEPHPEKRIFARAAYFLTSALDPSYADTDSAAKTPGIFNVTVVDAANLAGALAAGPKPSVVILPPLVQISAGLGEALANFVRSGGGLLAWVAQETDTLDFNNQFGIFSPARLVEPQTYTGFDAGQGWRLGWWNRDSALFGPIGETGHGDLTLPQFKQRVRLDPSDGAEVLATFEDKMPFLISRQVGAGRVLLVNASADTRGSDWPIHKTYLPVVQRMAYYLARRDPQTGFALGPSLAPTRHAQVDLSVPLAKQAFRLVPPTASIASLQTDASGVAHDVDLEEPGCYEIRDTQNQIERVLAVNFPSVESDLAAYHPDDISSQFHFAASAVARFPDAGATLSRREIWPWLLAAMLPLLLLELGWANRTRT